MTKIGDALGVGGTLVGVGYPRAPEATPEAQDAIVFSFDGGVNLSVPPENLDNSQAQHTSEMMLHHDGSISRAPSMHVVQNFDPHTVTKLFKQISLDFSAEMIGIAPPYIGVKDSGAMVFYNAGITTAAPEGWFGISVLGKLLFSNGTDKSYLRNPFETTALVDMTNHVIGRCFAQAFGRVFAGGVTPPGGDYQALGISWSSAADPVEDWLGLGSGSELLVSDSSATDKLIALRAIGLDVLGVCNRHSLWAGYPTGNAYRPADFRPRVQSVGAVSEKTVCATPIGLIMLTDDGVGVFDLNNFVPLSEEINPALLPLDYSQLDRYCATYDSQHMRYLLQTPGLDLWVYELPRRGRKGGWYKWLATSSDMVFFGEQSGLTPWNRQVGAWQVDTRSWDEAIQRQSDTPEELYLNGATHLVRLRSADDTPPVITGGGQWRTPMQLRDKITQQVTTQCYELEYQSIQQATLELRLLTSTGAAGGRTISKELPSTSGARRRVLIWGLGTSQNVSVELSIVAGNARLYRLRQVIMDAGSPINATLP